MDREEVGTTVSVESANMTGDKHNQPSTSIPALNELTAGQLRTAEVLHESLGGALSARWGAMLRFPVEIKLERVEGGNQGACLGQLEVPSTMAMLRLRDNLRAAVVLSNQQSLLMVELMLGGMRAGLQPARGLSSVERRLLGRVLEASLAEFQAAWDRMRDLDLAVDSIHANPELVQAFEPQEELLSFEYRVSLGDCVSTMYLVIPVGAVLGVVESTGSSPKRQERGGPDPVRQQICRRLLDTAIEVDVLLNGSSLMLSDLQRLKPGSILMLHATSDLPAEAHFNESVQRPGQVLREGSKRVFRLRRAGGKAAGGTGS